MKIYRFDPESCIYLGEDHCTARDLVSESDMTTIAPPALVSGHAPVYDRANNRWDGSDNEPEKGGRPI